MAYIYLNGEFVDGQGASLPIMDRGTLYGDGIYELIPVYKGVLFGEMRHLKRLQNSLDLTEIQAPMSIADWQATLRLLLEKNGLSGCDANIYFQITRGAPAVRIHDWPADIKPHVFAYAVPAKHPTVDDYLSGASAITHEDIRRLENQVKSTSLQTNVMLQHKAAKKGAVETILFRNGYLTEGSSSNIFIVKDKEIATPPADRLILNGVTRRTALDIAKRQGLYAVERLIHFDEVRAADEIWITSSTKKILPITTLDNKPVGCLKTAQGKEAQKKAGPIWQEMIQCFHQMIDEQIAKGANRG